MQHAPIARKFLVTGATGQIGTSLLPVLYTKYGKENVIATDINNPTKPIRGKFQVLDITRMDKLVHMQNLHRFTDLIHLGAILSAVGESNPILCRDVNVRGFENIIDLAHIWGLRVFSPSSMAVFGDGIPKENVQEDVVLLPNTVYGVTKVYNELLGRYYNKKFDMDIRAMRYPGIISNEEYEYNGTTDYSTEIFWKAIRGEKYTCYLLPDTALPMMHIDDCIRASLMYIDAPKDVLTRDFYNLGGLSISPRELYEEIKLIKPDFEIEYKPDFRQEIADEWPDSISDDACKDFGWEYKGGVKELVHKIFGEIEKLTGEKHI